MSIGRIRSRSIFVTDAVVGEVLFYVLRQCLGPNVYMQDVHQVWVKVYSRMLKTIVPTAVDCELKGYRHHSEPEQRPPVRASYMFSQAQTLAFSQAASSTDDSDKDANTELKSEKIRRGEGA